MKRVDMTLAYFIDGDKILLPLKKKKIGEGKHNGVGGKLEKNETHEQAMIRECIEEIGLKPLEYDYVGEVTFNQIMDGERGLAVVHVYICKKWSGSLIETGEMKPFWFDINHIPYDKTMDDDKYWLPLVLSGQKIIAHFQLDENFEIIDYKIEKVDTL